MKFQSITFQNFTPKLRVRESPTEQIFDIIRKKWLRLTPEEWVRQNMINYFVYHLGYPKNLLACEASIKYNSLSKRCDAIVFNNNANPLLIMEFKAQNVALSQDVFDQISVYNMSLNVPFLFVSNGCQHIFCKVDFQSKRLLFCNQIPKYSEIMALID